MKFVDDSLLSRLIESKNNIEKYKNWIFCVKICFSYELVPHLDTKSRLSRSFYKLYEMKSIVSKASKVYCICEAPGGFAEAILDINPDANLLAQSIDSSEIKFELDPKLVDKPRDITKFENILEIIKLNYGSCDLITADGGIDVSGDYANQESLSFKLILCEIYITIYSLKKGGNFILKVFDCFTLPTIQLLWILEEYFETVTMFKPCMSRPCNSEKYVICRNYTGNNNYHKKLHEFVLSPTVTDLGIKVPQNFVDKMITTNNRFTEKQISFLNETARFCRLFSGKIGSYNPIFKKLKNDQIKRSNEFLEKIKIHTH